MLRVDLLGTVAEQYHVESRNPSGLKHLIASQMMQYEARLAEQPEPAAKPADTLVPLPRARAPGISLEDAILRRESARSFGTDPLALADLAALLYFGNGIRGTDAAAGVRRNAPSAGNLGSVDLYPIVLRADGLTAGIYRYDALAHGLVPIRAGDFGPWLGEQVLLQPELSQAAAALVLVADFARLSGKYGVRGYRLGLLDAGHVSQNLYLVATALGLAACAAGGFIDTELDAALGIDGLDRACVLLVVVGTR